MERLEATPPCAFLKIFSLVSLIKNKKNCVPVKILLAFFFLNLEFLQCE